MPSEKQYQYAWNIAHALHLELPSMLNKRLFHLFISEHKAAYDKLMADHQADYDSVKFEQMMHEAENYNME